MPGRWSVPTLLDVLDARRRLAPHLRPTALHTYPELNELVGTEVWVKHENHTPVGAFKVRGGLVYFDQLRHTNPSIEDRHRNSWKPRPVRRLRGTPRRNQGCRLGAARQRR